MPGSGACGHLLVAILGNYLSFKMDFTPLGLS